MKTLRDNPIEEGIATFFEEKQKLEEEIREYEEKELDRYYERLEEEERKCYLEFLNDHYNN